MDSAVGPSWKEARKGKSGRRVRRRAGSRMAEQRECGQGSSRARQW